jgi:peroxiredoxin
MPEDSSAKQLPLLTAGKVTVLVFVSPYCNICFKTLQDFDRVSNRYNQENLEILGIVIEATKKQADELAQGKHISFSLREDPDNETAAKFNIAAVPTMIVLGRNGQLLFRSTGKDSDMRNITAIIREAVNDR